MNKIAVLTYHSHRFLGKSYETNDHVALQEDLKMMHAKGFLIIPLYWVVEWYLGKREVSFPKCIAITFDDGCDLDWIDDEQSEPGFTKSFKTILSDFKMEVGDQQPHLQASSFVIGSPEARRLINDETFLGMNLLTDNWWKAAEQSGLLKIYNHSWDHNHLAVSAGCQKDNRRGCFDNIDTFDECQCEIKQAGEYIRQKIHPGWPDLFAYPYGQSSQYLREEYFPRFQEQHGTAAAFGAEGGYLTKGSSRWNLPRFVCGAPLPRGWRSPAELREVLHGVE